MRKQKLTKFSVLKVSLVPWGANDEPISFQKSANPNEFLIFKSKAGDTSMTVIKKEGEETEEEKKKRLEEEEAKKKEAEASKSAPVKKEETEEEKKKREEEEAKKKAGEGSTEKSALFKEFRQEMQADIKKAIAEATEPIRKENEELRKQISTEQALRETRTYITKASTDLSHLGDSVGIGGLLFSIEKSNLAPADKAKISEIFKQADQGAAYLFKAAGYSPRPTDAIKEAGPVGEFNKLVADRMGELRKSADAPKDQLVLKSVAMTAISRERPDLAAAVLATQNMPGGVS